VRSDDMLEQLAAEARYRRERYDLYRAKAYGLRPTSQARLRELQRSSEAAEARLAAAKSSRSAASSDRPAEPGS
jgi:hypothetical protein